MFSMFKRIKKSVCLLMAFTLTFMLLMVVCGQQPAQSQSSETSGKKQLMTIGTATQAGTFYAIGNALATILNRYITDVQFSAQATAGSTQNIELLRKGEIDLALVIAFNASDAYNGLGTWEGKPKADFLTNLFYVGSWAQHTVVGKNSGINTVQDIKGKKVSVGAAGSGVEEVSRRILNTLGIEYISRKDFNVAYMGVANASEAMSNDQLDGFMDTQIIPASGITSIMATGKAKLFSFDDESIAKILKLPEFFAVTIPKGTYPNQDYDVKTIGFADHLAVKKDFSPELAYRITKVIMEHLDELCDIYGNFKMLTKDTATKGMVVLPVHSGAEKYFKEVGIIK